MKEQLCQNVNQTIHIGDIEVPEPKSILDFAEAKPSSPAQNSAGEFKLLAMEVLKKSGINDFVFTYRLRYYSNMTRSIFSEADLDQIAQNDSRLWEL